MKLIKSVICLLSGVSISVSAQNVMTSSPYSMFGVGEISQGLYGQTVGMGGVSYGMRDPFLINTDNPAGLTGMDTCKLMMDISVFAKNENYRSKGDDNHAFTGNFSGLTIGGRIMKPWYLAVGLTPYSSVGYYFNSDQSLEGATEGTATSTFEGGGGLSKVTLSNAIQLPFNLSFGVNMHYLFGTITQKETQSSIYYQQELEGRAFYADFGLQYHKQLREHTRLTLGAVYGLKQKLIFDNRLIIASSSGTSESNERDITQYIPMYVGGGMSLQHKTITYALDYTYREYSVVSSDKGSIKFKNNHELRTGLCYSPSAVDIYSKSYWKKMRYKAGFNVSTPYMQISGKSGVSWRASAGLEFPVLKGLVNTSFFYDHTQYSGKSFRRDVIGMTVSFSIEERFHRVKL